MSARTWTTQKPGSWQHPKGVSAVLDTQENRWWRGTTRWTKDGITWMRWYQLIEEHGPVKETE